MNFKIEIPNGYEIDKQKSTFENIVFKKIEKKLPEKWSELETIDGFYVNRCSEIHRADCYVGIANQNVFKTKEQAESSITLAKLTQVLAVYNEGWEQELHEDGYIIYFVNNDLKIYLNCNPFFLKFQSEEKAELFLKNFKEDIIKASPLLFGVKL